MHVAYFNYLKAFLKPLCWTRGSRTNWQTHTFTSENRNILDRLLASRWFRLQFIEMTFLLFSMSGINECWASVLLYRCQHLRDSHPPQNPVECYSNQRLNQTFKIDCCDKNMCNKKLQLKLHPLDQSKYPKNPGEVSRIISTKSLQVF